jgi:hypothetical protein
MWDKLVIYKAAGKAAGSPAASPHKQYVFGPDWLSLIAPKASRTSIIYV